MDTASVMKWLAVAMAIIAAASQGAIHLPVGTPPEVADGIRDWCLTLMSLYLVIKPFIPADIIGPGKSIPTNTPQKV